MRIHHVMIAVAVVTSLAIPTMASAEDAPRKIDFTQKLIGRDGKPFSECEQVDEHDRTKCTKQVELTLGWLAAAALDLAKPGMAQPEKTRRGRLAYRVFDAKDIELTVPEINTIIDALGDLNYRNTAIAAAVGILDPASAKK